MLADRSGASTGRLGRIGFGARASGGWHHCRIARPTIRCEAAHNGEEEGERVVVDGMKQSIASPTVRDTSIPTATRIGAKLGLELRPSSEFFSAGLLLVRDVAGQLPRPLAPKEPRRADVAAHLAVKSERLSRSVCARHDAESSQSVTRRWSDTGRREVLAVEGREGRVGAGPLCVSRMSRFQNWIDKAHCIEGVYRSRRDSGKRKHRTASID